MRNDVSEPLDRAGAGRVLPERNMRSHLVIIDGIFRNDSPNVLHIERESNDVLAGVKTNECGVGVAVLPQT
jgi:hypothetical protein